MARAIGIVRLLSRLFTRREWRGQQHIPARIRAELGAIRGVQAPAGSWGVLPGQEPARSEDVA